jgi:hypothetical protein
MNERAPHRLERSTQRDRFLRLWVDGLAILFIALNWAATQLVAYALRYPPFFMGRLFGHIYQPFAWWVWRYHWPHSGIRIGQQLLSLQGAWRLCAHIVFYPMIALVIVGAIPCLLLFGWSKPADLHGSASWGDSTEVRKAGL